MAPLSASRAQRARVQLDVSVPAGNPAGEGPTIASGNLLADDNTREILRAGFATKVHYRLELWRKGGWFDDPAGRSEWDVFVQYDPATQLYNVVRRLDNQLESFGGFATVTSAEAQFGRAFRSTLHPDRSGRFYYVLTVDVQPMQESDLDALQQWLRGPTAPGKADPLSALRGGVGRLMSRVLGGDKRQYAARTGIFRIP